MDVTQLTDDQLRALVENHERQKAFDKPVYRAALDELNQRSPSRLDFEKTLSAVRQAAAERRFLSYKDIADANGADWSSVHYPINDHLGLLLKMAHAKGWPLLTAIIVNKQNIKSGKMEESTLTGFVEAARSLGYSVTDEEKFLREQQEACFEWGASQS